MFITKTTPKTIKPFNNIEDIIYYYTKALRKH